MIENENIDSSLHGWKISEMLQQKSARKRIIFVNMEIEIFAMLKYKFIT